MNNKSYVSKVKSQIYGTCLAYSAMSALESAIMITNNSSKSVKLSMPHAIYGGIQIGTSICDGGDPVSIFKYIRLKSIALNAYYPLNATNFVPLVGNSFVNGTWLNANFPNLNAISNLIYGEAYKTDTKYTHTQASQVGLIAAVSKQPVTVGISVGLSILNYKSGIINNSGAACGSYINHSVFLVGYDQVQNFWILKNSWGVGFGEKGFFRVEMTDDVNGFCSMYVYGAWGPALDIIMI